ncbi:hypothetical protein BH10BAC5_BH10BAC5_16470 [soil metagenome]
MKKLKTKYLKSNIAVLFIAVLFVSAFITGCNTNDNVTGTGTVTTGGDNISISSKSDDNLTESISSDVIVITEAKALINEVEFEQEPSGTEHEIHITPFVVNFNVTGGLTTLITGKLPTGNFNKVKFKIHKPEDNDVISDPDFMTGSSGNERFSFIIKGTFNGAPFVYRSRRSSSIIINLNSSVSVSENIANVTVVFNKNFWFKNGNSLINPASGDDNMIDDNIRSSFRMGFKDNDHDGNDDH